LIGRSRAAIALSRQCSTSLGNTPCSRDQALRLVSSIEAAAITVSRRAAAVQMRSRSGSARAAERQRSNVATDTPSSRDTAFTGALSGGNNRATARSLNACPYLAMEVPPCPSTVLSKRGDNYPDARGPFAGRLRSKRPCRPARARPASARGNAPNPRPRARISVACAPKIRAGASTRSSCDAMASSTLSCSNAPIGHPGASTVTEDVEDGSKSGVQAAAKRLSSTPAISRAACCAGWIALLSCDS